MPNLVPAFYGTAVYGGSAYGWTVALPGLGDLGGVLRVVGAPALAASRVTSPAAFTLTRTAGEPILVVTRLSGDAPLAVSRIHEGA